MTEERRAAPIPNLADNAGRVPDVGTPRAATANGDSSLPIEADGRAARARDSSPAAARRRGRMTLRIPDDEIARPRTEGEALPKVIVKQSETQSEPPPSDPDAAVLTPMRIISIDSDLPPPPVAPVIQRPPATATPSRAWSPAVHAISDGDANGETEDVDVAPISPNDAVLEARVPTTLPTQPPDEPTTEPVLPAAPSTPRSLLQMDADDDEEVRFDDDVTTPSLPGVGTATPHAEPERRSDPGEAPEISAEDLVAVEAAPAAVRPPPVDLPPMRARATSQPSIVPVTAKPVPAISPVVPTRRQLVIVPPRVGSVAPQSTDGQGRRKGRLWWEDLFNDDYLRTMERLTDAQIASEVDFIENSLGIESGGAMLDLACGTGREAIELARRGYEVVAFDLSLAMLARAGDEAQERDVKLNFVQGDMREMTFEGQFDGVYCWNTAFGYFDEERNAGVVDRVHAALKGGGRFLLDVINRDFLIRQSPSLAWFEGDGCVCMDEMAVDFITSRMKVKRTLMLDDGRSREIEYSMRVYSLHELGRILHEHGFKVCEVSGRTATPGVFFGNESPRTIILAEKR